LGVSIMLLLRDRTGGLSRSRKWILGIAMLLYAPLGDHIAFAQVQVPILLMLVLVMRCLASRREIAAGLILALAIMLRAFPIVLAGYLLATRRWRALAAMTIGVVVIAIVTTAGLGLNVVRSFLDGAALTVSHHPVSLPINVAVAAFTTRLFWYAFGATLPAGLEVARRTVVVILELAILGLGLRAAFRAAGDRDADLAAFGLWVVISVMLSPIAWIHYMVLFLIPFAQIAMAANRGACRPSTMWLFVASYFLIAASIGLRNPAGNLGGEGWFLIVAECAFASVLLVFVAAYRLVLDRLAGAGDKSPGASRLSARAIG
jgi:Glycosyltransferase family 87